MVDRGAHDRQPQRDIDGRAKALVLEHRQALVVVHRQHRVAVFQMFRGEQRIGRQGADQVDAFLAQQGQCRLDDLYLFAAQMTAFTRVRIESADQNARTGDTELLDQVGVQDACDFAQALGGNGRRDILEWQVSGHQRHAQAARGEHHDHLLGMGQLGEKFGMPGKRDPGLVDHAFVNRSGDHAGEVARQTALACAGQGIQHVAGIARLQPARFCRRLQGGIPDIKAASGSRRLWPGPRADRQQPDIQPKQIAARLEQLKAGDGDHCLRLHLTGHEQAEVWTDAGRFAGSENEGAGSGHWHVLGMGGGCPSEMKTGWQPFGHHPASWLAAS